VRVYWEVARRAYRRQSTYRVATVAGVFTNTVFGFILASVLIAVFRERPSIGGFDSRDAVTFTFVSQGLLMVVFLLTSGDEISDRIMGGEIVSDLQRPVHFQSYWCAVALGRSAYYLIYRGIPPFVIGALAFDLRLPQHPLTWVAFLVSVALAATAAFSFRFLLQLTAFWILDARGPAQLGSLLGGFLSGTMVPLVLFPDAALTLVRALPFASMVQLPIEVFLDKHHGVDLARTLALQAAWVATLWVLAEMVVHRAVRKVVIQGG
jgi:ABC-2 type transport system permease protein